MTLTMSRIQVRERVVISVALVTLTLLAWGFLMLTGSSSSMTMPMSMAGSRGWSLGMALVSALMWCVMMVAMMLPSAGPMILTYARVHQQRAVHGKAVAPTWCFVAGYLAVWTGFGLLAAATQLSLQQHLLLSSAMGSVNPTLGGGLLILAGVFQLSPIKQACLSKCRTPLSFLMTEWREGAAGALVTGIRHGGYCLGCCWALMLLMFVGGVMSLLWMAGLALYFLLEKLAPRACSLSRLSGALLIGAGLSLLLITAQ